jgi:hypothetical protein
MKRQQHFNPAQLQGLDGILVFFIRGLSGHPFLVRHQHPGYFLTGAAKTVVTGPNPWRSGVEMPVIGLGVYSPYPVVGTLAKNVCIVVA